MLPAGVFSSIFSVLFFSHPSFIAWFTGMESGGHLVFVSAVHISINPWMENCRFICYHALNVARSYIYLSFHLSWCATFDPSLFASALQKAMSLCLLQQNFYVLSLSLSSFWKKGCMFITETRFLLDIVIERIKIVLLWEFFCPRSFQSVAELERKFKGVAQTYGLLNSSSNFQPKLNFVSELSKWPS